MKANVAVHVGDAMRLSAFRCVLTEPNPGTFLFEATEAGTVHIVHTAACHHLEVTRDDDRMLITMFNRKTNTYVMVSDFHESREAVFERFTAITKQIQ